MRKILVTVTAAAIAVTGLSACNAKVTDDGHTATVPDGPAGVPSETGVPGPGHKPSAPSHPENGTGGGAGGAGGAGGNARSGKLSYVAPGKFQVGDTVFFTATDTVLIVEGGKCPDGAARPNNRCTTDNMEMWVKSAPRFAKVSFSGQSATVIREVAG
ncbi:hypothetical protein [Actinomadura harenae]|uniref:Lipoprotein n=1 Tax=Actinomadura harenae TaxID=2483351 RepID=A0A3M2LT45_9ACTN|nr:hypothetical protein [Actinomadura harenae]RMI38048.1 hypothetical protein EBO15_34010 [Actinomadura harenae]